MNSREDSVEVVAEIAKEACIQAALRGFENASISGLCCIGAWEAAISAIRMLDLSVELKPVLLNVPEEDQSNIGE